MKKWKIGMLLAVVIPIVSTVFTKQPSAQGQAAKIATVTATSTPEIELAKKINSQNEIRDSRLVCKVAPAMSMGITNIKREKEYYRLRVISLEKRLSILENNCNDSYRVDTVYKKDTRNLIKRILNKNN